jgi:hypothetical protein
MTQTLLLQSHQPPVFPLEIECTPIAGDQDLSISAAQHLFSDSRIPVWQVCPANGAMDTVVDKARDSMLRGSTLQETILGKWLDLASQSGEALALFWANDYTDLPTTASFEDLARVVTEQILTTEGNWELYAVWRKPDT